MNRGGASTERLLDDTEQLLSTLLERWQAGKPVRSTMRQAEALLQRVRDRNSLDAELEELLTMEES